jgi:hypothetical protein
MAERGHRLSPQVKWAARFIWGEGRAALAAP